VLDYWSLRTVSSTRDGFELTKQTARAAMGASDEEEFGAGRASGAVTSAGGAIAGAKSPEAANGQRLSHRCPSRIIPPKCDSEDNFESDLRSRALTSLVRIGRVLVQDKLLYQRIGKSTPGVDECAGENQSWPAIAWRIVEVCKGTRDQIATNA